MLSRVLALVVAVVLFVELLRGKRPRYLLTLSAGGVMVVVVLLGPWAVRQRCWRR